MAIKRKYVNVKLNGEAVNLSVRAETDEEATKRINKDYKGAEIISISDFPPRKKQGEEEASYIPLRKQRKGYTNTTWTGREVVRI